MKKIHVYQVLPDYSLDDLENFATIPFIRRARDYHLYDVKAKRILDLYRGDGRQLLGYSLPGSKESVANRLAHGFVNNLPHVLHQQMLTSLAKQFSDYRVLMFVDRYRLSHFIETFLAKSSDAELEVCLPFLSNHLAATDKILCLPGLSVQGPFFLLLNKEGKRCLALLGNKKISFDSLIQHEARLVPFFTLGIALKSFLALKSLNAFVVKEAKEPSPAEVRYQSSLRRRVGSWQESDWSQLKLEEPWHRLGPYLMHSYKNVDYKKVFSRALSHGILLNPTCRGLSILPGIMSHGEKALLEKVLAQKNEETIDA